jgi:hypothetical protein
MGPSETNLEVDEVLTAAARLTVFSEEVETVVRNAVTGIRAIPIETACGGDEAGTALLRSYESGGSVSDILDGGEELCGHVHSLAEVTGIGAIETEHQDQAEGDQLGNLTSGPIV